MTRFTMTLVALTIMTCLFLFSANANASLNVPLQVPIPNTITMVDLGSSVCTPCQRMMPILSEIQMQYLGRAAIVYIDVDEYEGLDKQFEAKTVPTQIFYDQSGREVYRHEGFFSKDSIVNIFSQMGLPPVMPMQQMNGMVGQSPYAIQSVPYQPVYPGASPQGYQGATVQPGYGYPQPYQTPQAYSPDLINQYNAAPMVTPTGLLTPGVVNVLYFDVNAQNTQASMASVFSPLEQQYTGRVVVMAIDAGLNQGLAGSLGVASAPMLIVYDTQGQEVLRHPGTPSLPQMQNVMSQLLGR